MTKFKVGDKVRVLDSSKILGGDYHYFDGMETEVVEIYSNCPKLRNKEGGVGTAIGQWEFKYIELIKPTKSQRISALEEKVAELEKIVESLQESDKRVLKANPVLLNEVRERLGTQSNNQKRAAIIEKAKRFVEENLSKNHPQATLEGIWFEDCVTIATDKAEFIVNEKKRAVTVLIKGVISNTLFTKGIAKCHPHDVFNEHIGKAIALGRALGLDVSEFEQAVQPDEVVVGMEVYNMGVAGGTYTCTRIDGDKVYRSNGMWIEKYLSRITNDTNAEYTS